MLLVKSLMKGADAFRPNTAKSLNDCCTKTVFLTLKDIRVP